MQLKQARIVLTGATGGLGEALVQALSRAGAVLLLTARDPARLQALCARAGAGSRMVPADLARPEGIRSVAAAAAEFGATVLINNAGVGGFSLLQDQGEDAVGQVLATNLAAPVQLTRAMLPGLLAQPEAAIVNVGSAFGQIPFAGFAAYSAAKAGLHGFSQALRRELADAPVHVIHVSPRAIDTPMNSPAVNALNRALGNASDSPELVARKIVAMLRQDRRDAVIGFPERLFAWLNALLPGLVDRGLRGKLSFIKGHAARRLPGFAEDHT
jgi:short-subunit dehydrogenase